MSAVFLDLDGTLSDSRPGIVAALRATFIEAGFPEIAAQDLGWMVGPPFHESFPRLGLADWHTIVPLYRRHYNAGAIYDTALFPGAADCLAALREAGHRLYLCTAKPLAQAEVVTRHLGIAEAFIREFGPGANGEHADKRDLLPWAVSQTGEDPARSVMVGDREHDEAAAAAAGMAFIAADWGYAEPGELAAAPHHCARPADLPGAVAALLG